MFGSKKSGPGAPSKERARLGQVVSARLEANPNVEAAMVGGAQAYYYPAFLDAAQCDTLIGIIAGNRRPSTLLSDRPEQEDYGFRTSDSCDMARYSPEVAAIDTAIADLLGIPPDRGETNQGQRYAPDQQFRAHHDICHQNQQNW